MSITLAIYVFIVIAIAFIVKGLVGFGDPLVSNPLLAMRLDNKDIAPGLLPVSLLLNAGIVWKNRKAFSLKKVAPIAVCVMLGIIPGTMLLKFSVPWILKVVLGILIIGLGIEMLTRKEGNMKPNLIMQSFMSFLSGVTAGLFGINLRRECIPYLCLSVQRNLHDADGTDHSTGNSGCTHRYVGRRTDRQAY